MTETDTHVKTSGGGYSATKGCFGWLIFGPFGLLCGNCGSKQKTSVDTTNKTYWVCSDCGNKFRNLDDWKKEIEEKEKLANNTMIYCVLAFIAAFICFAIRFSFLAWIMLILGIVYVILIPVGKNQLNQEKEEYKKFSFEMMDKPVSFYAFEMLYWCGIREGELLALTAADFDFEKETVRVNKSYQRLHGEDVITTPKTKKSNRIIKMPKFLCEEMQDYLQMLYGLKKKDRIFTVTKNIVEVYI